jgi:hypothetical protein
MIDISMNDCISGSSCLSTDLVVANAGGSTRFDPAER